MSLEGRNRCGRIPDSTQSMQGYILTYSSLGLNEDLTLHPWNLNVTWWEGEHKQADVVEWLEHCILRPGVCEFESGHPGEAFTLLNPVS